MLGLFGIISSMGTQQHDRGKRPRTRKQPKLPIVVLPFEMEEEDEASIKIIKEKIGKRVSMYINA